MDLYMSPGSKVGIADLRRAAGAAKMTSANETIRNGRHGAPVLSFNGYGGEVRSNRRPNTRDAWVRQNHYAATWDQWGVLLGHLFRLDPGMNVGGYNRPTYAGASDFHRQTDGRFRDVDGLPEGFHGDHTFRWSGTAGVCVKGCTARKIRL